MNNSNLKICDKGHKFYKKSDCLVCPECEKTNNLKDGFLSLLPSPARRALEKYNINSLDKLASFNEIDILKFHGVGKTSIPILQAELKKNGLTFKKSIK